MVSRVPEVTVVMDRKGAMGKVDQAVIVAMARAVATDRADQAVVVVMARAVVMDKATCRDKVAVTVSRDRVVLTAVRARQNSTGISISTAIAMAVVWGRGPEEDN
jgi:hypothetical protein